MQWKNLPFWGQILIVLAFCAALIFVAYKYPPVDLTKKQRQITTLDGEIRDLESKVRIARTAAAKRKELEAEIRENLEQHKTGIDETARNLYND